MSDDRRSRYAAAFHAQATSDWQIYELLSEPPAGPRPAVCHALHYLQMACEKLSKAYRLQYPDANVDELTSKHVGFEKFVNSYLRSSAVIALYKGKDQAHGGLCRHSKIIAREIEKLAPAVDRTTSPENVEYPWERDDSIFAPCNYAYPALSLLTQPSGRAFIKMIRKALVSWAP